MGNRSCLWGIVLVLQLLSLWLWAVCYSCRWNGLRSFQDAPGVFPHLSTCGFCSVYYLNTGLCKCLRPVCKRLLTKKAFRKINNWFFFYQKQSEKRKISLKSRLDIYTVSLQTSIIPSLTKLNHKEKDISLKKCLASDTLW